MGRPQVAVIALEREFSDNETFQGLITLSSRPDDVAELNPRFLNRRWRDITIVEFLEDRDAVLQLSPEAFVFFLPALLRSLLLDFEHKGDVLYDYLFFLLLPVAESQSDKERLRLLSMLPRRKKKCIGFCLSEICEANYEFWKQSDTQEVLSFYRKYG